jgi:hypothetical protein
VLSHQDGCRSAVALLLKAALIQVSDYRLLGASGLAISWREQVAFRFMFIFLKLKNKFNYSGIMVSVLSSDTVDHGFEP